MDITIALGGGGSRGVVHIGVLRGLENAGFRIRSVAGTSIGSLVGIFYASGYTPDEIEAIFAGVDQSKLFGWPFSDGPGILGVNRIRDFLFSHLGNATFNDLKIPAAAVAVDLLSGREIILQQGSVVEAILGSIAVPGLFPPKYLDGYRLIDGGTLDPVPVRAARMLSPGLPVIAVSLLPPLGVPSAPMRIISIPAANTIVKQFSRLSITQAFQIFAESVEIASREMAELRLAIDKPELIIRPNVDGINLLDKVEIVELSKRGELATIEMIPALLKAKSFSGLLLKALKNTFHFR